MRLNHIYSISDNSRVPEDMREITPWSSNIVSSRVRVTQHIDGRVVYNVILEDEARALDITGAV